jgi:hypothetical protein
MKPEFTKQEWKQQLCDTAIMKGKYEHEKQTGGNSTE